MELQTEVMTENVELVENARSLRDLLAEVIYQNLDVYETLLYSLSGLHKDKILNHSELGMLMIASDNLTAAQYMLRDHSKMISALEKLTGTIPQEDLDKLLFLATTIVAGKDGKPYRNLDFLFAMKETLSIQKIRGFVELQESILEDRCYTIEHALHGSTTTEPILRYLDSLSMEHTDKLFEEYMSSRANFDKSLTEQQTEHTCEVVH